MKSKHFLHKNKQKMKAFDYTLEHFYI